MTKVKKSKIHGWGVFAERRILRNEIIDDPQHKKFRGYNRSCYPNAILLPDIEGFHPSHIRSVRVIESGEEITLGYPVDICACGSCTQP